MLPQDPAMLVSYLNLKLRDYYDSLSALCEDEDISEDELLARLAESGYRYDRETNSIR
ncbi:MAG: DUF4250 domain-containing protein [Lachnospiraceae bacterium]|nr:DUF4250 domain-containing protein [Lachnospiraceae bacterium]MBR4813380.1 DUF4250 domain-containing protein [Lachnospiraceae bacterium]MBR7020505.1 DUF4250 domain-containing protein [Lachnospiraceae bacterium]